MELAQETFVITLSKGVGNYAEFKWSLVISLPSCSVIDEDIQLMFLNELMNLQFLFSRYIKTA